MKNEGFMKPGWQGVKDEMREAGERTLVNERSTKERKNSVGKYHKLSEQQTNMHIPKKVKVKMPQFYNRGSNT